MDTMGETPIKIRIIRQEGAEGLNPTIALIDRTIPIKKLRFPSIKYTTGEYIADQIFPTVPIPKRPDSPIVISGGQKNG